MENDDTYRLLVGLEEGQMFAMPLMTLFDHRLLAPFSSSSFPPPPPFSFNLHVHLHLRAHNIFVTSCHTLPPDLQLGGLT